MFPITGKSVPEFFGPIAVDMDKAGQLARWYITRGTAGQGGQDDGDGDGDHFKTTNIFPGGSRCSRRRIGFFPHSNPTNASKETLG